MSLCVPHTPLIRGYRKQEDKRARRLRRLDNRGIEVTHLVIAIIGIIAAGLIAALVFYLFYGAKSKVSGFGTVMLSATGDAEDGIVTFTIQNELNVPITVIKVITRPSITLSNCEPSINNLKIPAGQSITVTCQASKLTSGDRYVIIIVYKTPGGHESTVTTSFVAS